MAGADRSWHILCDQRGHEQLQSTDHLAVSEPGHQVSEIQMGLSIFAETGMRGHEIWRPSVLLIALDTWHPWSCWSWNLGWNHRFRALLHFEFSVWQLGSGTNQQRIVLTTSSRLFSDTPRDLVLSCGITTSDFCRHQVCLSLRNQMLLSSQSQ